MEKTTKALWNYLRWYRDQVLKGTGNTTSVRKNKEGGGDLNTIFKRLAKEAVAGVLGRIVSPLVDYQITGEAFPNMLQQFRGEVGVVKSL